jgi:ankyrin repeat protein
LYFSENCEIRTFDINGNTLLHLAARSNSVNIAKLLKHLYLDFSTNDEDINISLEKSPDKSNASVASSRMDRLCFFDVNRKNNSG